MIGSFTSTQPAQSRGTTYDGFSGHLLNLLFSLFVCIFDLVHGVDAIPRKCNLQLHMHL